MGQIDLNSTKIGIITAFSSEQSQSKPEKWPENRSKFSHCLLTIFFKPFCNLYFSVYADALLWYQQEKIDYKTFCMEFQELSWMDGKRTPLNGKRLKMYIMSMCEVVEAYHRIKAEKV